MDRRDFLKTLAVTGAVVTVQRSEAMDILAQKLTNAGGGKVDLVAVMVENRKRCSGVLSQKWVV